MEVTGGFYLPRSVFGLRPRGFILKCQSGMFSNDWYTLICHVDVMTGGVKCQSFPSDFTEHVRGQRLPGLNKAYPLDWFLIECLATYSKGVVSQESTRHIQLQAN